MKPVAVVLLSLLAAACASSPRGVHRSPEELREELLQVDRSFNDMAQRTTLVEAFGRYLAPDATSMPLGRPFVHGRDAILASLDAGPAEERLRWGPQFAAASEGGDLAYTYGTWEYTVGPTAAQVELRGKYVTVWRRQPDGTWLAVFDGGNTLDTSAR